MSIKSKNIVTGVFLFGFVSFAIYYFFTYPIQASELNQISGTLEEEIKFNNQSNNNSVQINLSEDNLDYNTVGIGYEAFKIDDAKNELHEGSKVTLLIDNESSLSQKPNRSFGIVRFYSLESNSKFYLSLNNYNAKRSKNRWAILFIAILGVCAYIRPFILKRNKSTNPTQRQ